MSHEEPRREILPSRLADMAPAAAVYARAERFDGANRFDSTTYGSRASTFEWIARACRRHWWQILPLWGAAAAAIWWYLPRWFPNTYEATSVIQVGEGGPRDGGAGFATFKETQAQRVVTPKIVAQALERNPDLARQLATDEKTDQESAIIRGITAKLLQNTNLIQVTMTAAKDDGLAQIVDAVIVAYLAGATDFNEAGTAEMSAKLKALANQKTAQVAAARKKVAELGGRMGAVDAAQGRERHALAIEQHRGLSEQLLKADLEVVDQQARLQRALQQEADRAANPPPPPDSEKAAVVAFYKLPEVKAIKEQLDQVEQKLELAKREPGKAGDAGRKALQIRADDLHRQVDNLWDKLKSVLKVAAQAEPQEKPPLESSRIEVELNGLKARQAMLTEKLAKMEAETHSGSSEVLQLEFARQDMARAEAVERTMTDSLSQAESISVQPVARFDQEYRAKTIEKSASLPRWGVGVAAPLVWLFVLLGFFGLVEKRTGRILDPSDLPSKARLNVIGLVPPLPKSRPRLGLTSAAAQRSQMDFERFIQSIDQLRVMVCGRGDGQGRLRRSLLITSAGENEGKSTLAAQLAERSVNAGLLTLLIDADLRNPTLSRMFDRPESVGLANVLRGELLAEEAIGTVAEAGGFHFLPAGLVRDDLSRLLQSERLGRLLESARESFDLVLVDSPPVLPVADALTIGQWVDGAILAVRHKVSRLPLVERASRQLASVGISIIGAVVSGVKDRHTPYYGSRPASDPDRSGTVDSAI